MVEGYGSADNRRVVTGLMKVVVRCCEKGTHTPREGEQTAMSRPFSTSAPSRSKRCQAAPAPLWHPRPFAIQTPGHPA
eukprot:COSAG03_NODE_7_length_25331_cov_113.442375_6_plen_78_part_00